MMKSVPGGSMPAYMGGGPDPPLPLGPQEAPLVMNGESVHECKIASTNELIRSSLVYFIVLL